MDLQLRRRLTHLLAATGRPVEHLVRRATSSSAPACRPGFNQELLPLASSNGSRQCFEIAADARSGASIVLAPCTPANEARTRYWRGRVLLGQCACMDVAQPKPGAEVVATLCRRRRQWQPQGAQLRYGRSNLCLDYTDAWAKPNAKVVIDTCNSSSPQQALAIGSRQPSPSVALPPALSTGQAPASSGRSTTSASSSTSAPPAATPAAVPNGYQLVWSDEFNGSSINASSWNFVVDCNNANDELECYTDAASNAHVANGLLHIDVLKESYGGRNYTSARINTYGKFDFTYGHIEASIKLPCGRGLWPAFWLMPSDSVYGPWPQSGELDIMEFLGGNPNVIVATAHFGLNQAIGNQLSLPQGTFCDDFHRFALDWTAQAISWSVDGAAYANMTHVQGNWSPAPKWPFDERFYIILNVAMGGDWPGPPDPTVLDGTMWVDYVRVYQTNQTTQNITKEAAGL